MAEAQARKNRKPAGKAPRGGILSIFKSQWLATVLIFPLCFLAIQNYITRQDAREARVQSVNVDRVSKIQESGKVLDLAIADYFQAISELGLAEKRVRMPGEYTDLPIQQARAGVLKARNDARVALAKHGADVEALRGTLDADASSRYMTELSNIGQTIDAQADIAATGRNITALSRLVVARNALVDQAMKKVGQG